MKGKGSVPKSIRFDQVKVLTGDTKILGGTAAEWDAAFTGNMRQTLQHVKQLVESGATRDISTAVTDVASTVSSAHQWSKDR
ncbi:hypothetical protein GTP46_05820 [Duganella sp. FT135W]|uniref:Uncharacterized protein n=1 Tax=Duganella flavida TaxID=2692175 RepID=A0A6L8K4J8_9BURK|nr:hypothetical protein [Duganella flavida]MYM22160.1 hypothetical protein [Duganella flavida]